MLLLIEQTPFPHSRFSASIKHQIWNKHLPSNKHLPLPAKNSENLLTGYSKFITITYTKNCSHQLAIEVKKSN